MTKEHQRIPIEEESLDSFSDLKFEQEKIDQLLEVEKEKNPKFKECLRKLEQEYERRVAKANMFIDQLFEKMGRKFDWFIVSPVMMRTDYGYSNDIDLVIIFGDNEKIPDYNKLIDDVFIIPTFIDKDILEKLSSKHPEMGEWYKKQIEKEKPKGKDNNKPVDVSPLEEIRYLVPDNIRKLVRKYRLKLADHFISKAKKTANILSWYVSGSTTENPEKFSVCSDLDLEILTNPQTPEEENETYLYLHNYLNYKFAEDFQTKICFSEMTLDTIKRMSKNNPKMKDFYEKRFNIK